MRYGSICSGVEAATLAWEPLGWKPAFFAEVEPFPCAVLMQKFGATKPKRILEPDDADTEKERKQRELWQKKIETFPEDGIIPNLGDFTKIEKEDYDGEIDLLVGGPPCQSYSCAGLRKGLDDPRGNLALEFARLAHRLKTRWFCLENVLGILSQGKGRAFAEILSAFCGWKVEVPVLGRKKNGDVIRGWKNSGIVTPAPGGYGLAWRTLDAQFVRVEQYPRAVPQRRRRIFLIGSAGSWERAATVLFEPGRLSGDTPPQRQTGAGIARNLTASPGGVSGKEQQHTFVDEHGRPLNALCAAHGQGNAEICEGKSPTLNCNHEAPIICNSVRMREGKCGGGKGALVGTDISHTLQAQNDQTIICRESGQGFWREDKASGTVKVNGAEPTTVVCEKSYGIAETIINRKAKNGGNGIGIQEELQYTLDAAAPHGVCSFVKNDAARDYSKDVAMTLRSQAEHAVSYCSTVRRLMPVECERLMGFPDGHTQIEWNGKPAEECPDTPRYKACGNAFTVNCARWIGMRIQIIEDFCNERT
ncbi:MAG: DNA cytosine methyltransferase [Victivallaceae bacterium]|nr:DNA cytosine methyltransferase [Victivallaceae bacterium]